LVENGEVQINVQLEKRSAFLKLHIHLAGWLELVCDRCLENYKQDINLDTELFVKYGQEVDFEEGDNVIWVLPEEHVIDLAQVFYEYIALSIPLKQVHPNPSGNNSCNTEMLEKLNHHQFREEDNIDETDIDPRWAALKKLKNNN
jgi:uncharacterized metal-binding protein YceD (DUF177 family)